jgi:hypothetical protein
LDACVARELPGVHRDLLRLRALRSEASDLTFSPVSVTDSLALLPQACAAALRVSVCYQGELLPERVGAIRAVCGARQAFR